MPEKKLSQVAKAYERSRLVRQALFEEGRPMECTEDKAGIVWERFVLKNGKQLIFVATPMWHDVFVTISENPMVDATIQAIRDLADK